MGMSSLVDRFCPNIHDAPVTAAAYDPQSGTIATADASGVIAVQRRGEAAPTLTFQPGAGIRGGLDLIPGGTLLAVGDEEGTIGVYRTTDGVSVFREAREGARGRVRAFRGVALNPQASMLASISRDNLLRVWDLSRMERAAAWQGFSGDTVEFDRRGEQLLAMDDTGQPRLINLLTIQSMHMDRLQTPAEHATFSLDGSMIVAAGPSGISLLRVSDGGMINSFATQGGSGIINLVLSPDGRRAGAVTRRSVHFFSLPDLQPVESMKHGAPKPSGAALWSTAGVRVGGEDGLMHGGGSGGAGPVVLAGGCGEHRVAVHSDHIAYWRGGRRTLELPIREPIREVQIERDGNLIAAMPRRGPLQVFSGASGERIFDGGPPTEDALSFAVGGTVVAVHLAAGGCRWWDLSSSRGFELKWPQAMALSGGGTWLGVVTPRGYVHILDPRTGKDFMTPPEALADTPVRQIAFVNRSADMLVFDEEGVLGHYDLREAAQGGGAAKGRDIITINVEVDRIWGITGGKLCAMRLPEGDGSTILWVDLASNTVVHEVRDLHRRAWVDADNAVILEPARSSAILERRMDGSEHRVYRALPDDEWISFGQRSVYQTSSGAAQGL